MRSPGGSERLGQCTTPRGIPATIARPTLVLWAPMLAPFTAQMSAAAPAGRACQIVLGSRRARVTSDASAGEVAIVRPGKARPASFTRGSHVIALAKSWATL